MKRSEPVYKCDKCGATLAGLCSGRDLDGWQHAIAVQATRLDDGRFIVEGQPLVAWCGGTWRKEPPARADGEA